MDNVILCEMREIVVTLFLVELPAQTSVPQEAFFTVPVIPEHINSEACYSKKH
jgi:hypothetical protein